MAKIGRGVTALLGNAVDAAGPGAASALSADRLLSAARLLNAVLAVGRDRDIRVVAKGIETTEQLALLARLGCPAGQGFLFARPMDPADAEVYLRQKLQGFSTVGRW